MSFLLAPDNQVFQVVPQQFGVSPESLFLKLRKREIVQARQMTQLILYYWKINQARIASTFMQDASTVNHSIKVMTFYVLAYPDMRKKAQDCCVKLDIDFEDFFKFCRMTA